MKIAISGKGGVGKTTLTALLAHHYASEGRPVLAIDADPSPCLGEALGFPEAQLRRLRPIAEMKDLIAERTGATGGQAAGAFFKLNPRVDDLPERFSEVHDGIRLLLLGAVEQGGSGCICPASTLVKQLVKHLLLERDGVVLLDLYAGVEHLGRGTAEAVDMMIAVAEPTQRSMGTVRQIKALAADIGVHRLMLVGNKASDEADRQFFKQHAPDIPLIGVLEATEKALIADRTGQVLYRLEPKLAAQASAFAREIETASQLE